MKPSGPDEVCDECGFRWSLVDGAIRLVEGAPDRYTDLLTNAHEGQLRGTQGSWSARGNLWHVVDVIRFGTERLWTLTLDPGSGIPGWDQEVLAEARHYEKLSVAVGLRALSVVTAEWAQAARAAPTMAEVEHPELGTLTTAGCIRRNAHEVQHHQWDIERALVYQE